MDITELCAGLDELAATDVRALSYEGQLAQLESAFILERKLHAFQAARLQAAHEAAATVEATGRPTKKWLVEEQMFSPAEAGRRQRLARLLPFAPIVSQALTDGDISTEHANLILAALRYIPDAALRASVEEALVDVAKKYPPFEVGRAVEKILTMLGLEKSAADANERRYAERGVGLDETIGGTGSLNGTLTAEALTILRLALDAASTPAGPEDDRTLRQRRHDGLLAMAKAYLSHTDTSEPAGEAAARAVITMDVNTLLDRLEAHEQSATLGDGVPIAPETARRLACDAEIIPAVLGAKSDVLDIGRSSRPFNAAIRRAAWIRDGGRCVFPRCTGQAVHLHHIDWWCRGGHTSLTNAAWACAFHHWLIHEGRWTLRRNPDGSYTFTDPRGLEHTQPRDP